MAARIPAATVDEIRSKSDILAVIGQRQTLVKRGTNWVGTCPFCKSAGHVMFVMPEKALFYCFDCQAAGDIFRYVMQADGLSFVEAIERFARLAGVEVVTDEGRSKMLTLLRDAISKVEAGEVRSIGFAVLLEPGGIASTAFYARDGSVAELASGATLLAERIRAEVSP